MKKETWVVTANSSHARLFKLNKLELQEMDALVHQESRMHDRDLRSDKPGETFESAMHGRYAKEQQNTPKKVEAINFSREVAEKLNLARAKGEIDRIYLAASPAFLGLLRQSLDSQTAELIEKEVDKDITHLKPEEIIEYFPIGL